MPLDSPPVLKPIYDIEIRPTRISNNIYLNMGNAQSIELHQPWLDDVAVWVDMHDGLKLTTRGVNYQQPYIEQGNYSTTGILRGLIYFAKKHKLKLYIDYFDCRLYNLLLTKLLYLL